MANIKNGNYKLIDFNVDDVFLNKTFLGFSYLVPHTENEKDQQKYYSSVFRNINIQGEPLLPQESRASLYFLDKDRVDFFSPAFVSGITLKNFSSESKADFVRFLALLSQYAKDGNSNRVARGFKPKMEKYYEEYIYSVVGESASSMFKEFSAIFPDGNYKIRLEHLQSALKDLAIPSQFTSIIEMDTYLFGLIYTIVFENKTIDIQRGQELREAIEAEIAVFRSDDGHKKAPSALKYLKARINTSIEIYQRFTNE